jgi:hypothetical protein
VTLRKERCEHWKTHSRYIDLRVIYLFVFHV